MDFDATLVPQDIVSALSLEWGSSYTIQNVGFGGTLFLRAVTAVPAVTERAFRVESGNLFMLRPTPGADAFNPVPLWAWTDDPRGCAVIVALAQ